MGKPFRQGDVKRLLVASKGAGLHAQRIELSPDGKITLFFDGDGSSTEPSAVLDKWLSGYAHQAKGRS